MNNDINNTLQALVPILQMNGENVQSIEAVQNWYNINGTEYMKEVAEITYTSGYRKYADIGCDANLTAVYDVMAVLQEIKPCSKCIGRIVRGVYEMPAVEPELKKLSEWKADFKGDINALNIPKDDYDGIMEYIDEVPAAEQEAPDINVGNMDITTHDSIPAKTGKNDGDGTSGDCISRAQAIDTLRAMQTYKLFAGDDMLLIDQAEAQTELMMLPSAQPERKIGRWIPCSERLPEDEYVLISKKPSKISGDKWCVAIAIRTADPRSRKIQWRDSGFGIIPDDKVLAWMPLPEPYRKE